MYPGNVTTYAFNRLDAVPTLCRNGGTGADSDPLVNFDAFWATFQEQYAFFNERGVDWNALPADYRKGIVFGLGAAVTYAAYLLSMRRSRRDSTSRVPSREIAAVSLFGAAMLGATALFEGEALAISSGNDVTWLICYGVLSHGLGMLFITSSLPHVTPTQAGVALLLQPTLSFVWDVAFFARPMSPREFLGAAIALLAIYLGSRTRSEQSQRSR